MIKQICLDTSVIRHIIDDYNDVSGDFERIKQTFKVKFRISETAYAEILADLADGSISPTLWAGKRDRLKRFLDLQCPIQEQGHNLSVDMNIFKIPKHKSNFYNKRYWQKSWWHLYSITSSKDLTRPFIYFHKHKPYKLGVKEKLIEPAFDDTRKEWYKYFTDVKPLLRKGMSQDEIATTFENAFSKEYDITKIIDFIKVLSRYTFLLLDDKNFNPYSKNRKNDSIDFSFIQLLSKPVFFCTGDTTFQKFVIASDAPNKDNVKTPQQIIDYYK